MRGRSNKGKIKWSKVPDDPPPPHKIPNPKHTQERSATKISSNTSSNTQKNSPNKSSNMSTNIFRKCQELNNTKKITFRKLDNTKNTYKNKGIYAEHKQEFFNISSTAHTFPHLEWRETRSHFGSGNKTVSDPKSQPVRSLSPLSILDTSDFRKPSKAKKRSQTAILTRKANRKQKRAEKRKNYRRLRKCHDDQASHHASYPIAQDCSSKNKIHQNTNPMPVENPPESIADSRLKLSNIKIATLNLDGGLNHVSGRQKIMHLMKQNELDILALQETRINSDSMEEHEGHTFYFSTSITYETKAEADSTRETQRNLLTKTLSEIELYNLDAEKQGVALVYGPKLKQCKHNIQQINGRLMVATFNTAPLRTNFVVAYAPHAGRALGEKDTFYNELNEVMGGLPKHETNIILGDFNTRLLERLPHECDTIGQHLFRDDNYGLETLSEQQIDNRTRFISFCQEHSLVVSNTWFEKEAAKLVTYRCVAAPNFQGPYTPKRYAQLDFILINKRWKNSFINVESSNNHAISTDHKLLVAKVAVKLAKRNTKKPVKRGIFRTPTAEEIQKYNELVASNINSEKPNDSTDPFATWARILIDCAAVCFIPVPSDQKKPYISDTAWQLLCTKQQHNLDGNHQDAKTFEKQLIQQIRADKRKYMREQLEEMNESGYKWSGIKKLRKKYTPTFTKFRDSEGAFVSEADFPEKAADYLAHVQWKQPEGQLVPRTTPLSHCGAAIKNTAWEIEEFNAVIKASKSKKTPGPDNLRVELIKYLNAQNREALLVPYNAVLCEGKYFESLNLANIASIYKKGDPSKLENYRPIALLQTFYKLLAGMIKNRLSVSLEPWIQKTQYGFRPQKSTSQALFLARRLLDIAERQGTNMTLVLLDWEKAFDKINQAKLLEVLTRLSVPDTLVRTIHHIYLGAKFRVVRGENHSSYKTQDSGIRQGCPLSPYLFSIVMSAVFQDIKAKLNTPRQLQPITGIHFAEVLYADDTLLFGTHTHTINKLLKEVQEESEAYNMKLNLGKCINLTLNRNQSSVKFLDGTAVPRKTQAIYLGALLTDSADNHKEVIRRIGTVQATIKHLHPLWAQACTSVNWRLRVFDAVIKSKILYGLESIQLTQAEQSRLDALQMKTLRKILRVPTTFVDREWTNQKVIDTLEHRFKYSHTKLSTRWKNNKTRLLGHILRAQHDDPMREVLFEPGTLRPRIEHCRRVGKPRTQWLIETCQDAYAQISPHDVFDINNLDHMNLLARWAHRRERPFHARHFPP